MLQIIEQFVGVWVTFVKVASQRAMQDFIKPLINPLIQRPEIRNGQVHHSLPGFLRGGALEKVATQQKVAEDHAGGEQVGAFVGDLKICLLRAHVIRLTGDDFAFVIDQKPAGFGDPEVCQLYVAFERDHDVFEADIAVHDAQRLSVLVGFGMGVSQTPCHAAHNEHGQFLRQHPLLIGQLLGKLLEVHTADQFHRDKINASRFAEMVGLDYVGVDQVCHKFGFSDKVIDELLLVSVILPNHFNRDALDEAARAQLLSFVHYAHAAFKNFANDLVMKLVLDGKQGHETMLIEPAGLSSPAFKTGSNPEFC